MGTLLDTRAQSVIATAGESSRFSINSPNAFDNAEAAPIEADDPEAAQKQVPSGLPWTQRKVDLPTRYQILASMGAGATAGAVAKTIIAPLDRTKIYFQTHPKKHYRLKGALKFLKATHHNEGFFSMWRGNSATMARIVPYSSMQFVAHEQYKKLLGISSDSGTGSHRDNGGGGALHFVAGSLAGMTGQAFTYPLDRARAVMAVTKSGEYRNIWHVLTTILRNEGVSNLFRGFAPTMLGVIPYAGVSFFTYENMKLYWKRRPEREAKMLDDSIKAPSPTPLQRFFSGALAGLLGQTASYPLDIVRRRMQTASQMGVDKELYSTILGTLKHVLRTEGFRKGLYKGLSMNFIKGPIAVGVSFTTYDYFFMFFKVFLSERKDKAG